MNGTSVAVAVDPAPQWRAWIWFSEEVPTESESACSARLDGESETWGISLSWEGTIRHDEVTGYVSWFGPELKAGDTLRLYEGEREIGWVRILGEER